MAKTVRHKPNFVAGAQVNGVDIATVDDLKPIQTNVALQAAQVAAIIAADNGYFVRSGGLLSPNATPTKLDLAVAIDSFGTSDVAVAAQVAIATTIASLEHATLPKWVAVELDSSQVVQFNQGAAATSPAFPTPTPGRVVHGWLYIPSSAVNTTHQVDIQLTTNNNLAKLIDARVVNAEASVDIQVFYASGTWIKPGGAKLVRVIAIGGGGAGGSGAKEPASTAADGGGGGSAGGYSEMVIPAATLLATESVVVGAAGVPGGTRTSTGAGAAGGAGGQSTFTIAGAVKVYAGGGNGGAGGAAGGGNGIGGAPTAADLFSGLVPRGGGGNGADGSGANASIGGVGCFLSPGGGGGGGGNSAANTLQASAAGGRGSGGTNTVGTGPAGGVGGGSGVAGSQGGGALGFGTDVIIGGGGGGGGGGRTTAGAGVAGGVGGPFGGGGGGGGNGLGATGTNANGNGGAGYIGVVVVITHR